MTDGGKLFEREKATSRRRTSSRIITERIIFISTLLRFTGHNARLSRKHNSSLTIGNEFYSVVTTKKSQGEKYLPAEVRDVTRVYLATSAAG